ncbi:MAG: hypothetical protein JWR12_3026 [Mucilaginibacter sp.]|nr:hypothetical protein [Mucilaginibacter sp.]
MENKTLQDLLKKVIAENQNVKEQNISSLDEKSSTLLKGGTVPVGCSKIKY